MQLSYTHLIDVDHQTIQNQILKEQKQQVTSRKNLHKRRAISVADARKKIIMIQKSKVMQFKKRKQLSIIMSIKLKKNSKIKMSKLVKTRKIKKTSSRVSNLR